MCRGYQGFESNSHSGKRRGNNENELAHGLHSLFNELRKNHAVERKQMTDRYNNDAEQVKKVKQAPPGKKKKINLE
jgi:hypothetical protein